MKTSFRRFPTACAVLVWIAGFILVLPSRGQETPGGAGQSQPSVPKGYRSSTEALAAVALGQVKMVQPSRDVPATVTEIRNLEYGKVNDRSLRLNLFVPKPGDGETSAVPAIIFVHGGAWAGGDREQLRFYALRFAERGYVTAAISYRLSREAAFPAAVEDAKCAVRWLRANAGTYNVDPDRMAMSGNSAGGHLAMMAGYAADAAELEGKGGHDEASSAVRAVVTFYGPCDLTAPFARESRSVRRFLQGKTYEEARDLYEQASPIRYLTADDPPTLIFHGTIDEIVPVSQSDALAAKLKELGVPHRYERLEGWPHAMDAAQAVNDWCLFVMAEFFDEHLPLPRSSRN